VRHHFALHEIVTPPDREEGKGSVGPVRIIVADLAGGSDREVCGKEQWASQIDRKLVGAGVQKQGEITVEHVVAYRKLLMLTFHLGQQVTFLQEQGQLFARKRKQQAYHETQ
jgi:hypothetical protein